MKILSGDDHHNAIVAFLVLGNPILNIRLHSLQTAVSSWAFEPGTPLLLSASGGD